MLAAYPSWTLADALDLDLDQLAVLGREGKPDRRTLRSAEEFAEHLRRIRAPDYRPWDEVH